MKNLHFFLNHPLAVTTFSERLFHMLTTRIQNEFFLMFSLHLGLNNLYLCPLMVFLFLMLENV